MHPQKNEVVVSKKDLNVGPKPGSDAANKKGLPKEVQV